MTLQSEIKQWSERNFPNRDPLDAFLGVVEEVGELSHTLLKYRQGIRGSKLSYQEALIDAVGDITIYLIDFCIRYELDYNMCVQKTWERVKMRDWLSNPSTGGASG